MTDWYALWQLAGVPPVAVSLAIYGWLSGWPDRPVREPPAAEGWWPIRADDRLAEWAPPPPPVPPCVFGIHILGGCKCQTAELPRDTLEL